MIISYQRHSIIYWWISKSNVSKESCCEVEYDAYDKINMWRISIVILQMLLFFVFLKKMAIEWWKKNHIFYVYQIVSTCQTVCFYPRNCSFWVWAPMALFEKTAPKDIKKNILSQERLFFIFLRSTYMLNIMSICPKLWLLRWHESWVIALAHVSLNLQC